jgi:hypothetical protein
VPPHLSSCFFEVETKDRNPRDNYENRYGLKTARTQIEKRRMGGWHRGTMAAVWCP